VNRPKTEEYLRVIDTLLPPNTSTVRVEAKPLAEATEWLGYRRKMERFATQ